MKTNIGVNEKVAFGLGDFASNLVLNSLTLYLMFYYTDIVGIPASAAGTILFVARAIDAFCDLGMGAIVDRTHTRWGRCRPYLLFGAPVLALAAIATFSVPHAGAGANLAYAYASYIVLMMAYSLVNVPYSALPGMMSDDSDARARLAAFRMFFAFCGWLAVSAAVMPLVQALGQGDKARGFQLGMTVLAGVALLLFFYCFAFIRERVTPAAPTSGGPSLALDLRAVAASRAWQCTFIAGILVFIGLALPAGLAIYFVTYVAKRPDWITGYFVTGNFGMIAGVLLSDRLTRRIDKRSVIIVVALLSGAIDLLFMAINPAERTMLYGWVFLNSVLKGASTPIIWAMIADTADSIEAESGRPVAGLATSTKAFAAKFGLGLGGGIGGLVLGALGYHAGAPQTAATEHGMVMVMSVAPALCDLGIALAYAMYPLTRERMIAVRGRLRALRAVAK